MLFYGNRRQTTTMFIDDLFALKNLYPDGCSCTSCSARRSRNFRSIGSGRLDADKVAELYTNLSAQA